MSNLEPLLPSDRCIPAPTFRPALRRDTYGNVVLAQIPQRSLKKAENVLQIYVVCELCLSWARMTVSFVHTVLW